MTKQEINIIVKALEKNKAKQSFIDFIKESSDKTIVDIICYDDYLVNYLPKQIINMYEEEIIKNADIIFKTAIFKDFKLLKSLISRATISDSTKNTMIRIYKNPENLNKYIPKIFSEFEILNFSEVKLSNSFIMACNHENFSDGFLLTQEVNGKVIRKILHGVIDKKFFEKIEMLSISNHINLTEDAILDYYDYFSSKFLVENYDIPLKALKKVVYDICHNEEYVINLLKNTNLSENFLFTFVPVRYLQYYFAYNKFVTEKMLIKYYKSRSDINWIYVFKYINLSCYTNLVKILFDKGCEDTIEQNLIYNSKNNKIYNINELGKIGIDLSCIDDYITNRTYKLSIMLNNL